MNMPSSLRWAIGVAQQTAARLVPCVTSASPTARCLVGRNSHAVLKKITEKFQKHFQRSFVCL